MAFGVRIDAGGEGATGQVHFALEPGNGLLCPGAEQRLAGGTPGAGEERNELGVVVKHLLEMWHEPAGVGGVAGEAATDVVADAALADVAKRGEHDVSVARVAGAIGRAPQELEQAGLGEFGRAVGAAVDGVHEAQQALRRLIEQGAVEGDGGAGAGGGEMGHQRRRIQSDGLGFGAIDVGDFAQHVDEGRAAVAGGLGEIGATPDGSAVGGEEHGERPAALLAGGMESGHVDLVDVGALLTIDLDVHEKLVHDRGSFRVFEAFVGHDMAPMTGGIADGEENGLVGGFGLGERGGPPGAPMDGVVLVLKQIGAGFVAEEIFAHRCDPG